MWTKNFESSPVEEDDVEEDDVEMTGEGGDSEEESRVDRRIRSRNRLYLTYDL